MNSIGWSELLSAGHNEIDAEHRTLMSLINECVELSRTDDQEGLIVPAVLRLILFAEQHFSNEERLMAQLGYPYADEHITVHRNARQHLHQMCLESSGIKLCREIGSYLTNWFFAHATLHDKRLGDWIAQRRFQIVDLPSASDDSMESATVSGSAQTT